MPLLPPSSLLLRTRSTKFSTAVRYLSTRQPIAPAFAFDIDGVLKQGELVLPEAKAALQILNGENKLGRKFPFICVTNGGGSIELARSKRLTKELGVPIEEHQIVQSHTIFRPLALKYGDKPVLIVGGKDDSCRIVAGSYGFRHAYIPADVVNWKYGVWPFNHLTEKELSYVKPNIDFSSIQFSAILVFHDSRDWGRDIQLVTDLLRSDRGVFGTSSPSSSSSSDEQLLPVYFSNPDLLWGNDFPQPRLGQGAFQESLVAVYKALTGLDLKRTVGGKPSTATYDFASKLLYSAIDASQRGVKVDLHAISPPKFEGRVYMVGDNPASDIAGANGFGWESILVRTGVFRGRDEEDSPHRPTIVSNNVLDGVKWALEREGFGAAL